LQRVTSAPTRRLEMAAGQALMGIQVPANLVTGFTMHGSDDH